jgi:hypothetical protein
MSTVIIEPLDTPAPDILPKGYLKVEGAQLDSVSPDTAAEMLSDPKLRLGGTMRRNLWRARDKVFFSHAPMVWRQEDSTYYWDTARRITFDVKAENRMKQRSCRQLMKIERRGNLRCARLRAKAATINLPDLQTRMLSEAARLDNLACIAHYELQERRCDGPFMNPDGN